jgi:hypothetical protein
MVVSGFAVAANRCAPAHVSDGGKKQKRPRTDSSMRTGGLTRVHWVGIDDNRQSVTQSLLAS